LPQPRMLGKDECGIFSDYLGVRLGELDCTEFKRSTIRLSMLIREGLIHVDEWRREQLAFGISAVTVRWLKIRIRNAKFILQTTDWSIGCKITNKQA
jgi:hypothetical protein